VFENSVMRFTYRNLHFLKFLQLTFLSK